MFFRFACAMGLVVLISLMGAALDKETLVLRRRISQQQYQRDLLAERQARLRLMAQRQGTPTRWLDQMERGDLPLQRIATPLRERTAATPLLNWTSPADATSAWR